MNAKTATVAWATATLNTPSRRPTADNGGAGICSACGWKVGALYDGRCAPCAINGALYRYHKRCAHCGAYEGGPHLARMHPADE